MGDVLGLYTSPVKSSFTTVEKSWVEVVSFLLMEWDGIQGGTEGVFQQRRKRDMKPRKGFPERAYFCFFAIPPGAEHCKASAF
jgi:hypothetical protein